VLDQHPLVREAAVVAREDDLGNRRLVACVTGAAASDIADLRALVHARLPEFMMPAAFVVLDRMPLTANGKIDRLTLARTAEIVATEPDYIASIGLAKHLSPTRSNGLAALLAFIRNTAQQAL
jgi:acyl-coenzyme A synthetase/AMP-(fatty) acid ligase